MVMLLEPTYYTAEMVRALPDDGNRYELVWGELLVSPSARTPHQRLVARLLLRIGPYCLDWGGAEAFISPADISWSDDTLVQPDLFVVPIAQATAGNWTAMQDLLLVAEVLSPSTARNDRFSKRRLYQNQGVPLILLFDIEHAHVEVRTPSDVQPAIVRGFGRASQQPHPPTPRVDLTVGLAALRSKGAPAAFTSSREVPMNSRTGVAISSALLAMLVACNAPSGKSDQVPAATGMAAGTLAEPNVNELRTNIEAANQKAMSAMLAGDMAGSTANYSDSAVVMMPGMPAMRGRMAYESGFKGMMDAMKVTAATFHTDDVMASGDLAIETGTFEMTTVPKGGKPMEDKGKYISVWKKQADGSWKIVRDINNSDMMPMSSK